MNAMIQKRKKTIIITTIPITLITITIQIVIVIIIIMPILEKLEPIHSKHK